MTGRIVSIAALAACLISSSSSLAATVQYHFEGTVENSYLARPLLGLQNDDPIAFSAVLNVDADSLVPAGFGNVRTTGVTGVFTLSGQQFTADYGEDYITYEYRDGQAKDSPVDSILGLSTTLPDGSTLGLAFSIYDAFSKPGATIDQSPEDVFGARLFAQLQAYDRPSNSNATSYDLGDVKLSSIGLISSSAVPEPATWSMLVVGFGFAGLAMRRRSRSAKTERQAA